MGVYLQIGCPVIIIRKCGLIMKNNISKTRQSGKKAGKLLQLPSINTSLSN
jgi:hypothetical protein